MSQNLVFQQLGIVITAKDYKATFVNPELLQYSGTIPQEWELARPPIYTNNLVQVTYTNGISIVAESGRIIFLEATVGKATTEILVPVIARSYIETLPNIEYEAIGINPRGYVPFNQQQELARKYLTETLLSRGAWQEVGDAPMRATINLVYPRKRAPLYLTISEAALRMQDETTMPIVMFDGSFSYEIINNAVSSRRAHLHQIIDDWQVDLSTFQEIINTKFLTKTAENVTASADLFAMSATA